MEPTKGISIQARTQRPAPKRDWTAGMLPNVRVSLSNYFKDTVVQMVYFNAKSAVEIELWVQDSLQFSPVQEVGGLLLGSYCENAGTYDLMVDLFVPFREVDTQSSVLLKVGQGFPQAIEEAESIMPDLLLLGWFHTHPGHTPFLSNTDLQQTHLFFSAPYQIAVVLDPLTENFDTGVFSQKADSSMNNAVDQSIWIPWKDLSQIIHQTL